MKSYDVAVIGAGASGMMAAIAASHKGKRVLIIDRNPQLGRKVLATGNGRCNLTNSCIRTDRYHGATSEFISRVLNCLDGEATLAFFRELGLVTKEEDSGRIFPVTNQASSVVEVMRVRLLENRVDLLLDAQVKAIDRSTSWKITLSDGRIMHSHSLIIATGGRAAHQFGSTGDGLYWAEKLGHKLTPIFPALVPIETVDDWTREIQGIKVEARVSATNGKELICEKTGDLIFTNYGLSGPSVMALARTIAPVLKTSKVQLHIRLFPNFTDEYLDDLLLGIFRDSAKKRVSDALIGLLPDRMIPLVLRACDLAPENKVAGITRHMRSRVLLALTDLTVTVSKLRPLKEAQVTAGGLSSDQIDPHTLESKLVKSLYFAGEILDVDGDSGGFNLQWAWSSGYVAGIHAG